MTLTVRLEAELQAALDQHCARLGVTKTLVVQECLAQYLVAAQADANAPSTKAGQEAAPASANHRAFTDAGLIGAVSAGVVPADKAGVRQQALRRLAKGADAR